MASFVLIVLIDIYLLVPILHSSDVALEFYEAKQAKKLGQNSVRPRGGLSTEAEAEGLAFRFGRGRGRGRGMISDRDRGRGVVILAEAEDYSEIFEDIYSTFSG